MTLLSRHSLLLATALAGTMFVQPVMAQSASSLEAIQAQINALQAELKRMRADLAARDRQMRVAQNEAAKAGVAAERAKAQALGSSAKHQAATIQTSAATAGGTEAPERGTVPAGALGVRSVDAASGQASGTTGPAGTFRLGGVTVTLGGFVAAEGVYRTRNTASDIGTGYGSIPLAQSANAHTGEFRGSARQSRLSLLVEGDVAPGQKVAGYYETDFLGVGTTSNSTESNSYVPRLRQVYVTYDNAGWGLHVLAGQAWSLVTLNRVGITPRQEDIPLTIDAQYVPGFNWKRQWQLRADTDMLDHRLWLGASLEAPQTNYYTGPNGLGVTGGTALITTPGSSLLNSTANYSDDIAPDLVVKAAFDPGWGHYELYGLGRLFHDRVSTVGNGHNDTVVAGGVGGGVILPLVPKMLEFQLSGLAGYGIGSYGTGQLPDAVLSPAGSPRGLPEYTALAGLVAHPSPAVDLYGYAGTEQVSRVSFNAGGKAYGYGNPFYSNGGCSSELSALTCVGNTSGLTQGTLGGWWRFLKGNFGTVQAGAQYSYTRRSIFEGTGATAATHVTPSTDDNVVLFSFRYLPFQ